MEIFDFTNSFRATEQGFSVVHDEQDFSFADVDVIALSFQRSRHLEVDREEVVFAATTADNVIAGRVQNSCPIDQPNPISAWRKRIQANLQERCARKLLDGESVNGPRWKMDTKRLANLTTDEHIPLREIHSASWDGETFVIWKTADTPFLTLPRLELNTPVLAEILTSIVPRRKASSSDGGLGSLYAEFGSPCSKTRKLTLSILVCGVVCGIALFTAAKTPGSAFGTLLFVAAITAGLRHLVAKHFGSEETLQHGEFGLRLVSDKSTVTLDWQDARTLSFKAVDQYVNGTYVSTHVALSVGDDQQRTIDYAWSVGRSELKYQQIEAIRDDGARQIADHMWNTLQSEGKVAWTKGIVLTREGMTFELGALDNTTAHRFVDVSTWQIKKGQFSVCLLGKWDKQLSCSTAAPNFFPGLLVFEKLMQPHEAERMATV